MKLTDFGREFFVTAKALASVLKQLKEEGFLDAMSASSVARHRKEIAHQTTEYGNLIQQVELEKKDGSVFKMWVQHPLAMLAVVLSEKPEFAALLLEFESPKNSHVRR